MKTTLPKYLTKKRFLIREKLEDDRQFEILSLTPKGNSAYHNLLGKAEEFNQVLTVDFTEEQTAFLIKALKKIIHKNI